MGKILDISCGETQNKAEPDKPRMTTRYFACAWRAG